MKKLLGILVLGLLLSSNASADINLWCKGDNRTSHYYSDSDKEWKDTKKEITGWLEVKITDTHIVFPKESKTFYPTVERDKEIEKDIMYWGTNLLDRTDPKQATINYTIDRIEGTLEVRTLRYQMVEVANHNCTTTKPKKLF